jgi:urea carboxylase
MFGITPLPIYDPREQYAGFDGELTLFRPGDIVTFSRIDRARYDELRGRVEGGTFERRVAPLTFELERFLADSDAYDTQVMEVLDGS